MQPETSSHYHIKCRWNFSDRKRVIKSLKSDMTVTEKLSSSKMSFKFSRQRVDGKDTRRQTENRTRNASNTVIHLPR